MPGYSIIGDVAAVGAGVTEVTIGDRVGVLTVVGGYTEYLYWKSSRLIPVPAALDPAEAVTLILNYIVAYQTLHRSAKVKAGDKVLIIGASGGLGTAFLQLGKLAGLKMYGIASKSKHHILSEYGATPIDYRTQDFVEVIRQAEPTGLDAVLDGVIRLDYIRGALALLRRGGRLVSFGDPGGLPALFRVLMTAMAVNVLPNGKSSSCTELRFILWATNGRSWKTGLRCSTYCKKARYSRLLRRSFLSWKRPKPMNCWKVDASSAMLSC